MQAPFLCLISFLVRCRYLSISHILTRVVTVPGEYVPLPLSKGMIHRISGKIHQVYSTPLYIPWGQVARRLSPSFAAELSSQNLLLMCHLSLLSTKTVPQPHLPQATVLYCSQLVNHPNAAFHLDEMTFVWCQIYCFSLDVSTRHVSSVSLSKCPRPPAVTVLSRRAVGCLTAELDHPARSWFLPVLGAVHFLSQQQSIFISTRVPALFQAGRLSACLK